MKKIIYAITGIMLFGLCYHDGQAQSNDEPKDEAVKRVKVNVVVNEDGETKTITREYTLPAGASVGRLADEMEGVENIHAEVEDGEVRIMIINDDGETETKVYQLPSKGTHPHGEKVAYLGVKGYTTNANSDGPKEVRLMTVIENSPAYEAGLRNEDILLSLDGEKMTSMEGLAKTIRARKMGDVVEVKVKREGKEKTFKVTLGERTSHEYEFSHASMGHSGDMRFESVDVRVVRLSEEDKALIDKSMGIKVNDKNQLNNVDLKVFPNPGNGEFSYELELPEGGALELTVLDKAGKQVVKQKLNNTDGIYKGSINLESSPSGTYILIFKRGDKLFTEKLLKS